MHGQIAEHDGYFSTLLLSQLVAQRVAAASKQGAAVAYAGMITEAQLACPLPQLGTPPRRLVGVRRGCS